MRGWFQSVTIIGPLVGIAKARVAMYIIPITAACNGSSTFFRFPNVLSAVGGRRYYWIEPMFDSCIECEAREQERTFGRCGARGGSGGDSVDPAPRGIPRGAQSVQVYRKWHLRRGYLQFLLLNFMLSHAPGVCPVPNFSPERPRPPQFTKSGVFRGMHHSAVLVG